MNDHQLFEQAKAMSALLPPLVRQLFAVDNDPAENLPLGQLRVCAMLYGGPRPMSALGRELGVSFSAMTQIADRLERARLVSRASEEADRRVRCLQLTPRGERIMRRREEARVARVLAVLRRLPAQARSDVLATLNTLVEACAADKAEEPAAELVGENVH